MADYVLSRNGGPLQSEVNSIGTVDSPDYDAWRARFGNTSGSGSGFGGRSAGTRFVDVALAEHGRRCLGERTVVTGVRFK